MNYINGWCNPNRIKSKLSYLSPNEFEAVTSSEVWSVEIFFNTFFITESWVYQTKLFYNHD